MVESRHRSRRRGQRAQPGGIAWLVETATGEVANALHRDLFSDQRDFNDLGWRGLWDYITAAPPGTAIHYHVSRGHDLSDEIALEMVNKQRELLWRYTAVHFKGGSQIPFPEPLTFSDDDAEGNEPTATWETVTADQMISPEVRALLEGA